MSSAVPIHPMLRLARQGLCSHDLGSRLSQAIQHRTLYTSAQSYIQTSRRQSASKSNEPKNDISASSLNVSSASTSSTAPPAVPSTSKKKKEDETKSIPIDSIAIASYAASPRGQPASPPPSNVKLTDKRGSQAQKEVEQSAENLIEGIAKEGAKNKVKSNTSEPSVSGQKVPKGASLHPAAVEQDRQANIAAATSQESGKRSSKSVKVEADSNRSEAESSKLTEGIVIPANRASTSESPSTLATDQTSETSQRPLSSSSTVYRGSNHGNSRNSNNTNTDSTSRDNTTNEANRGGLPAVTQVTELGSIRPTNPLYPFDTHVFVKRLIEAKFVSQREKSSDKPKEEGSASTAVDTSLSAINIKRHDPAEAIMEATRHLIVSRGGRVIEHNISKTEVDNQAYLFTAALSELRTELQVRARNDAAALRSMVTLLQREVDSLNQKMREDVAGMKHDIQVDMNNRKGEAKEEGNTLEQEIQDLNNRFTISISDLKTEIEQNIKWDATRRALTVVFGCVVILIATLTAADHLTREDVEEQARQRANEAAKTMHDAASQTKPKSAEEIGLIANYDESDGSRYV